MIYCIDLRSPNGIIFPSKDLLFQTGVLFFLHLLTILYPNKFVIYNLMAGKLYWINKTSHTTKNFQKFKIHNKILNHTDRQITITKKTGKMKAFLNQAKFTSVYLDIDAKFLRPEHRREQCPFRSGYGCWISTLQKFVETNFSLNSPSFQKSPLFQNFSA